ncbi:MAG TPA: hypothetical protein VLX32_04740 [Candidatus Acidoferrum sp.]|nr:hypothetical protein [Candidatus Acidoferrum sp.]
MSGNVFTPNGLKLGAPGPVGSPSIIHFADAGDPNSRSDPDSMLANCALGSVYSRTDPPDATHALYIKTSAATSSAPTGTWTNK